jgi:hypothetical protein
MVILTLNSCLGWLVVSFCANSLLILFIFFFSVLI